MPSGRVISLGRLMLASLYLLAALLDPRQPANAAGAVDPVLAAYVGFAAVVAALTWRDWWLDSKLAGPAHGADIAMFTFLVLSTEVYTSPFFSFFMFILLSSAIRWGWRATALSAVLLTLLFVFAGALVARSDTASELQPFLIRTGHLVIVSLILIWFGINQWRSAGATRDEELLTGALPQEPPLEAGLAAAMKALRARRGLFVWHDEGADTATAVAMREGDASRSERPALLGVPQATILYDLPRDRALSRDQRRNLCRGSALDLLGREASGLGLGRGMAMPIRTAAGRGILFLEQVRALSSDHIDLGDQAAADVAAHMQRRALLKAAEEAAEARSRLGLARDLHDSVVQFLAGAAFRLEAMKRASGSGADLEPQLNELKHLMLEEQGELREFIAALRGGPRIDADELAGELDELAKRLSRQWGIRCSFSAETEHARFPGRLQFDAKLLLREAVANAVRHAGATSVTIKLKADADALRLDFINNGAAYPGSPGNGALPRSLKERVEQAGGAFDLSRGMGVTRVSVSLPVPGSAP